jgi:hypothetical protein
MSVCIPVIDGLAKGLCELCQVLEAPPFEDLRTQLLRPRFNQIEPTGVLGQEVDLNFGPGQQGSFDITAMMNRQVVLNQQPAVGRELTRHLFPRAQVQDTIPLGREQNGGLTGRGFKGSMHQGGAAAAIIRFQGGSLTTWLPYGSWVGLGREGTQLVDTHDPRLRQRRYIGPNDCPFFP